MNVFPDCGFDKYLLSIYSVADTGSFYQLFYAAEDDIPLESPSRGQKQHICCYQAEAAQGGDMKAGPESKHGPCCGSLDMRDIEAQVPMAMSWEPPLPHKLLGMGTNITPQGSRPGWLQEAKARTTAGPSPAKEQLCPLPSVLKQGSLPVGLPNKAKDRTLWNKWFSLF